MPDKDLRGRPSSQPIVVFAHIPLWTVYQEWGWGTDDGAQALSYLKRFGSVTVLNGHIHQIMQKVEGNVAFHTALSTAFPQPAPGTAPSPGPIKDVPPGNAFASVSRTCGRFTVRHISRSSTRPSPPDPTHILRRHHATACNRADRHTVERNSAGEQQDPHGPGGDAR